MRFSFYRPEGGRRRRWLSLLLLLGLACSLQLHSRQSSRVRYGALADEVSFADATAAAGLERYSETFGVAVVDIDNDGRDDLVISNHYQPPSLFLNKGGFFIDRSDLLPDRVLSDWHGVTAVDLDNDGDQDLIFAGGGTDGVGPGEINRLFKNLLTETGALSFEDVTKQVGIAYQPWRTRVFLPLPSPNGAMVDLYMVGLPRPECPNLYFSNSSQKGNLVLTPDPSLGLNQILGSEGLDIFFDYDRDGGQDLVLLKQFQPTFFERLPGGYRLNTSIFQGLGLTGTFHVAAGDLNNDGYPDLYLSAYPPETGSDNLSFNGHEIHFVVRQQAGDQADEVQFAVTGTTIDVDLTQHTPGNPVTEHDDIFLGQTKANPKKRIFTVTAAEALGRPAIVLPGIYIWKDVGVNLWHIKWFYGSNPGPYKGKISAQAVSQVGPVGFETLPAPWTEDVILLNDQGRGFKRVASIYLHHNLRTRSAAMLDLNNDGLLDIIGIRGSEQGRYNGEPFVMINRGNMRFDFQQVMTNPEDDIFQADQMVYGFFNDDGLPDIFYTNGNGLNPGDMGPYKLFLNTTATQNDYVILKLKGRASNRNAIGAEVELFSSGGTLLGYRQVGMGFNRGQHTLKVHFGLGKYSGSTLTARIKWPGASTWDERTVTKNSTNQIVQ
jgi:hypothetical protein